MPLYEVFCLAKSRLLNAEIADLMKRTSRLVLSRGGVLTDVKSFGAQPLAYEIKRPGERHTEVGALVCLCLGALLLDAIITNREAEGDCFV